VIPVCQFNELQVGLPHEDNLKTQAEQIHEGNKQRHFLQHLKLIYMISVHGNRTIQTYLFHQSYVDVHQCIYSFLLSVNVVADNY